ncbi:mycofactocin biosynthesis chaperone MftB [Aeromicrobium sp. UC242_57]|uniref:mycofactocin biosynthesis chaperone MftB n=1 Tax=Aeromicrobium sp. UC242_57 TaxID=3374624 RepID=UPI00379AE8E5
MTTDQPHANAMLDEAWDLSPAVALRPEPFGAMAYHFGNREPHLPQAQRLVDVVRGLSGHPDVRGALEAAGIRELTGPATSPPCRGLPPPT